ncbi:MAG: DNA sulfur modification protein DndB, partial [Methylocystis sp.]
MDRDTLGDIADSAPLASEGADDRSSSAFAAGKDSVSVPAQLVTQGRHRFYALVLPSSLLAETCVVEPRVENPIEGFQRLLDEKRAKAIAKYIDAGFGTVPGAVVLSAQSRAHMHYDRAA